jgi:hypothetical protein
MAIRRYKKISELDALASASLSTYVAGVDNGETVKITLDILADGVRNTINTLDVQRLNALEVASASLSAATSSYETKGRSIISSSAQITVLGFISSSQMVDTGSFLSTSSFQSFSSSIHNEILAATNEQSFNGLISGSSQLTSSYDERYVISGSITQTTWDNIASKPTDIISSSVQITAYGFVSGSYETTGRNILSGSISYNDLTNIPQNIASGSYETTGRDILSGSISYNDLTNIPNGIISSSEQLTSSFDTRYTLSGSVQNIILPTDLISSSAQIEALGFITGVVDIDNYATTESFNSFTQSYQTDSASFDGRITNLSVAGVPSGTVSGSSQLTASYDTRYTLSGSIQPLPSDLISSSAQITSFGFVSGSYETTGRGIISESVVTISETQPLTGIGNLWYDSNLGNLYLHYDTNTWVDTSNGVIQTIISDGSLLSTASFNNWTSSYTASVPAGTISSSTQISALGFISSSTAPAGTISSSTQIAGLGYAITGSNIFTANQTIQGNLIVTGSLTAQTLIFSSSVYYSTASYSSGSTIFGNSIDDTHQYTGSVSITGSLTASLQTGYTWVGNGNNVSTAFPTSSLLSTASFNSFTSSQFNTLSASVAQVQTNLNQVTASLGVTSTPFNYTSVVNPTNYVLVSYPTASYNGGSMDIILSRASDSTAVSVNTLLASYGGTGAIASKGSTNSGAGAPNPSFDLVLSGSVMNIRVSVSSGTYNIKGVARLF